MSAEHPAWVSLSTSARRTVAVPGAMAVSAFFYVLVTWVVSGVWEAAAERTGTLAGYTAAALVWYIAASEGVTIPLNSRLISELGGAITDGTVATELLRPVSVVWQRVAVEIGRVLPRLAMCAGIGLVLATVLAGAPPNPLALALAAPSMVLAVAVNIVAQHAFSAAAFWLRETGATWFLYQKLVFLTAACSSRWRCCPVGCAPSRWPRRSRRWPTHRRGSRPAMSSRGCCSCSWAGSACCRSSAR